MPMFIKSVVALCCSVLFVGGAYRTKTIGDQSTHSAAGETSIASEALHNTARPVAANEKSKFDACSLLDKSEIASVQGAPVQQIEPTSQPYRDLNIAQCYYTAVSVDGSKNLGVYLQVIQRDSPNAGRESINQYWKERFGREVIEKLRVEFEAKEKIRTERQKAKAIRPPQRVSGVGDEAFWLASSRGGALFVRKKDKVVRISVGGTSDAVVEIEKAKALAKKALARLS